MSKEQQSEMQQQRRKKQLFVLGKTILFLTPSIGILGSLALFLVGYLAQSFLLVVIVAGSVITLLVVSPMVGLLLMDFSGLWLAKKER